ncbi:MAG: ribose 5-phosphate isomerase B [Candidatus Gastranaerophilaceae bacterium]
MENLKIAIGADHGGFKLKEKIIQYLRGKNIEFKDFGTFDEESCNYPEIAKKVAQEVANSNFGKGILVCGTGIGMSIAANKIKGIRAALCSDAFSAKASRGHNDANILCLGQRTVGEGPAIDIVDVWLNSKFEGGRHKIRVDMIE